MQENKQNTTNIDTDNSEKAESQAMKTVLPMMALDDIPTVNADAKDITGLIKSRGVISGYQLSDGTLISKQDGVTMAKAGQIRGVGIAHNKDTQYLKSIPDGSERNNLSSLPTVSLNSTDKNSFS